MKGFGDAEITEKTHESNLQKKFNLISTPQNAVFQKYSLISLKRNSLLFADCQAIVLGLFIYEYPNLIRERLSVVLR
ncbi:MAG: hypothetical protein LBL74_06750 [Bacteroidales bacterium]|jgi:hypothetical protein|nr:hypothetical protein [Bacteroidales bacterium]